MKKIYYSSIVMGGVKRYILASSSYCVEIE